MFEVLKSLGSPTQLRETAGALALKAKQDKTVYDPLEVGYALSEGVYEQLLICGRRHASIFDEKEYFLSLNIAGDPLIHGLRRHKYAAWLYLPSPRPHQSVYLFDKSTETITRLWSLPQPWVMAIISEMKRVSPQWEQTKRWCDAFFNKHFWHLIRKENSSDWLSEHEYLNAHRKELIQAGGDQLAAEISQSFDFSKVATYKVIDPVTPVLN